MRCKFHGRQTSVHSPLTFLDPRDENRRKSGGRFDGAKDRHDGRLAQGMERSSGDSLQAMPGTPSPLALPVGASQSTSTKHELTRPVGNQPSLG
ncbi:MAG TPA: hypothetical protein PLF25_05360 [Accumulibacter sp.]|nr:hypothetical protein [Accumulibacter sp.]